MGERQTVTRQRKKNGVTIPTFIYGTAWKEEQTEALVTAALAAGFQGVDTANQRRHYYEAGVGAALRRALAEGSLEREELFIQTKYTYLAGQDERLPYDKDAPCPVQVRQSAQSSLEHLGLDYVDSYVLHGPSTRPGLADVDFEVWQAIEALADEGLTKLVGVSNVSCHQLELLWEAARIKPAVVQNRCFARMGWDKDTRAFCREHDIVYEGFSLLTANRAELQHPDFLHLVERSERTAAQVVFRFALQVGMVPLTGTTSAEHMATDLQVYDFELSDDDVARIETIAFDQ